MQNSLKTGLFEKIQKQQILKDKPHFLPPLCFVGFDGFHDDIVQAVDTRQSATDFKRIKTIAEFAQRIHSASGKSANIELVPQLTKIGGNAPIMSQALINLGNRIVLAASIGSNEQCEPLFQPLVDRCERTFGLGSSGHSDAIEFLDGKIILGKLEPILNVSVSHILQTIGEIQLHNLLEECSLFACVNWTMLSCMTQLWKEISLTVLPNLTLKKRWLFVDIADPAKRVDQDLKEAFEALKPFQGPFRIVLGLNEAECRRIASLFHPQHPYLKLETLDSQSIIKLASIIQQHTSFDQIVVHTTKFAVAIDTNEVASIQGPYCPSPLFTTGGGDNFNAGYCSGLISDYTLKESLLVGVATSGYYVRKGISPTLLELEHFINELEDSFELMD